MKFQDSRKLAWSIEFELADLKTQQRLHLCEAPVASPASEPIRAGRGPRCLPPAPAQSVATARREPCSSKTSAVTRLRQRGITMEQVRTVVDYGQSQRSHGASRYDLDLSARARLGVEMPEALRSLGTVDILVVVADDGCLVAAAHRTQRLMRDVAAPLRVGPTH